MHLWFLNALSGSWHGISSTPNQNRIQLEIKINTWLMFKSIPKPKPIFHPSLSQYQNQGSKSIHWIQYRYLSRNQPVSPIPDLYSVDMILVLSNNSQKVTCRPLSMICIISFLSPFLLLFKGRANTLRPFYATTASHSTIHRRRAHFSTQ